MKRLRHPIRAIREPFGTAGLIIACLALVLALGGSAIAVSSKLSSGQKKEVEKIAKKYAGKPGAAGANGAAGPVGAAGKNGNDGTNGSNGSSGGPGSNGVSVTSESFTGTKEGHCAGQGGSKFVSASGATFACNGATGYTEFLPEGKSEMGRIDIVGVPLPEAFGGAVQGYGAISFVIPLETAPTLVMVEAEHEHEGECPGTKTAPEASEGFLCVYKEEGDGTVESASAKVFNYGADLHLVSGSGVAGLPYLGSWAVTAPEKP